MYQLLTEQRAACVAMRDALEGQPLAQEGMTDIIARTDEMLSEVVKGAKVRAYLDSLPPITDNYALAIFAGAATVEGPVQ